jgi:CelD/BcsL family acetyltransferase involved in cellulose biosynthesis
MFLLRAEWLDLFKRCPDATPFQSPQWVLTWLKCWPPLEPRLLVFRHGNRLVGLIPAWIENNSSQPSLKLMGSNITDYQDGLIEPGFESDIASSFQNYLLKNGNLELDWEQLSPHSCLLKLDLPGSWQEQQEIQVFCPVVVLPKSLDTFEKLISKKFLHIIKSCKRRLGQKGQISFEVASSPDAVSRYMDELLKLHAKRWSSLKQEEGLLVDHLVQKFHREVSLSFLEEGWLRFSALSLNGQIISLLYGFSYRGMAYYYVSGFDPDFFSYSVGSLAIAEAISLAISEGSHELHFLRGQEGYKYRWGAIDRPNFRRKAKAHI